MGTRGPHDSTGPEGAAVIPDEAQARDDRTLRLSSAEPTPEDVEAYLRYQRALRDELEFSPVCRAGWTEHLSEAHRRALEESGLEPGRYSRLSPLAADFAGRRMAVRRLKQRLAEADPELRERLTAEVARLDNFAPLERRHGSQAIAALRAREDDLVALHEQLSPLLSRQS